MAVLAAVIAGCASVDDRADNRSGTADGWALAYCKGLDDFADQYEAESPPEGAAGKEFEIRGLEKVLADADAAGPPPPEHAEFIAAFRDYVASGGTAENPVGGGGICNAYLAPFVVGDRFVLAEVPAGFEICTVMDFQASARRDGEWRSRSRQMSLWSDGSPSDPFAATAVLMRSPRPDEVKAPAGTEMRVNVMPDKAGDAWHLTVTLVDALWEENSYTVPTGPDGENLEPIPATQDAVFDVVVTGADEATARNIAQSLRVDEGVATITYPAMEPLIPPTDMGYMMGDAWWISGQSPSAMVNVGPSHLSVSEQTLLAEFTTRVEGPVRPVDSYGDGDDFLGAGTGEGGGFTPQAIVVGGHPAFAQGGPSGGVLYLDWDDSTVRISLLGPGTSIEDLIAFAEAIQRVDAEAWLEYVASFSPAANPDSATGGQGAFDADVDACRQVGSARSSAV